MSSTYIQKATIEQIRKDGLISLHDFRKEHCQSMCDDQWYLFSRKISASSEYRTISVAEYGIERRTRLYRIDDLKSALTVHEEECLADVQDFFAPDEPDRDITHGLSLSPGVRRKLYIDTLLDRVQNYRLEADQAQEEAAFVTRLSDEDFVIYERKIK